ncbi:hypothetical protein Rhopal_006711-T1 [Rhodotorula paludigena]|uniref:Uncharacterized protein n=1 Tax=Rhodotorula paludigena TaxID=86838 RepID=A0AAV5GT19_9BASI|nr:hypothetical protein Rhopal_006711-T1 [Rhodotorula paludigena]
MTIGFLIRMSGNYAWQFLFTFLSPCAFLANDYVLLKHIARAVGPDIARRCLFIPARGIVWIFVLSDVVTFCAQTAGTILVIIGGKLGSPGQKQSVDNLRLLIVVLALSCIGIMIRSVFRLIEQADGFFGTIAQNEVWLYLFDAAPLWISMTLFVFVWPPRYINGTDTACTGPSAVAGGWNAARHDGRRWGHGGERT